MVNHIIAAAVRARASDIHIEPGRELVRVRYRIDGQLREDSELPKWVQSSVSSRIKLMAELDIAEKRVPQDGRFGVTVDGRALDLRTSTLPTSYGEKIVIRILDSKSGPIGLDALGMPAEIAKRFRWLISRPQGIVLVTGPTGSGKTTTLYGALSHVHSVEKNITTLEDPVEYDFDGINQVGINERAGRTFPGVLTSILRQDPDVVMVGEMRDATTATIHTNDTVSTITRLRNLGIPSYLIASTITCIVAQRLVRRICERCKVPDPQSDEAMRSIGLGRKQDVEQIVYRGDGCGACGDTGYAGRVGIYELLVFTPRVREYISRDANESIIRQLAVAEGTRLLLHDGQHKVLAGITTLEEVQRVAQTDEAVTCSGCNEFVSPEFIACPSCGEALISKCHECGTITDSEWSFCPYCATQISDLPASEVRVA
jgi:type II secretory ATPase GspE/PulE/Tfp pilus assembly ATPase PilB-like protein/RNA polymerase subunit RPABC4/transcription elongation factor Spt4